METPDLLNLHVIQTDCHSDKWHAIPALELEAAFDKQQDVLLLDHNSRKYEIMPLWYIKAQVDGVDDLQYRTMTYSAHPEHAWPFDSFADQLLYRFHYTWFNALKHILFSEAFRTICSIIKQKRGVQHVWPAADHMFNVFLYPLPEIRSVWLGATAAVQEHSVGWLYSHAGSDTPVAASVLQDALRKESAKPLLFSQDLVSLYRRAHIFAASINLSNVPEHEEISAAFMKEVIKILNARTALTWVLFAEAAAFSKHINAAHTVLLAPDPNTVTNFPHSIFTYLKQYL